MIRNTFLFSLLSLIISVQFSLFGQTAPDKYWIQFADKTGTPYSITQPEEFLSAKAIGRRLNQQIGIKENDLPINPIYIDSVLSYGVKLHNRSKWMNAITIEVSDHSVIPVIASLSFVANSQKLVRIPAKLFNAEELPVGSSFKKVYDTQNFYEYGNAYTQISMLNGQVLHNSGFRGSGMIIAVIDAGFFRADTLAVFEHLRANNQIIGTWDFVDREESVYEDFPHGMQVLSVMGGHLPGEFVGVAPESRYWLLRSEDASSEYMVEEDNWIAAAEFADSVGADIINTSLGYTEFDDSGTNHTYSDMDGNTTRITIASDIAASKGMLVVNSAGNAGWSAWNYIVAPSDGDSVMAVGAVDEFGVYAPFSSKGPSSDGRVKPNVSAMGASTAIAGSSGNISISNGTSFSSPIIAGLAACLWQANPQMTNMEIFRAIEQSASLFDNPNDELGYGLPDFAKANLLLQSNEELDNSNLNRIIKVFPNPFRNEIHLSIYASNYQNISYKLIDIAGKSVHSSIESRQRNSFIDVKLGGLNSLPSGIYVLQVNFNGELQSVRIVK